MFLRSLQWRLVFIFISITVVLMSTVWYTMNYLIEDFHYQTFQNRLEKGFEVWALRDIKSDEDIIKFLAEDGNDVNLFLVTENKTYTIIKNSEVKYSSYSKYQKDTEGAMDEILRSENYLSALAGEVGNKKKLVHWKDSTYFDYARRVNNSDYILYFRYDSDEWKNTAERFNNTILGATFIAVIASLIIGFILSKTITVPIVNIMHKAQKLASGDFGQVLEVKSDDEIGKLTEAFNNMAGELKDTLLQISSEKNKIETILNYMTDGVIAFNLKGEVIHANPAVAKILGTNDLDMNFNDFALKYNIGMTIEEIIYLETLSERERSIKAGERYIRLYFALFTDESKKSGGIIAVMQDITEQQKLENMRKEFVANVSHELRTPLTSIKSYTETLLDGAMEDRETTERFLGVIDSEADRMGRLVKDLLQLSRLDNQQMYWNMKEISFADLVKNAVEKLKLEAANKNQVLESFTIGEIPNIKADRDRIEQVVLNVLSNAVKYTPSGGEISVYIGRLYSDVYVKVADTGIGIPQEDLNRIFERFYRVDKARSREMGGTGLGLAIAKELVEAHGGSISVSSEFGKGTEVTIKLPLQAEKCGQDMSV